MSHYRLSPQLGLCEIDGRLVMLDLRRDRYFELDTASAAALRLWREGALAAGDGLSRLLARNLLQPCERPNLSGWPALQTPRLSLLETLPKLEGWRWVPGVAKLLFGTRQALRRGLEHAVDEHRRRQAGARPDDPSLPVARFRSARRLVPFASNCLTDSLALSAFLANQDIASDLVFGVKLDPFAAHCWLQAGGTILNDAADNVAAFTPIMVA